MPTSNAMNDDVRQFTRFAAAFAMLMHIGFIALFAWWGVPVLALLNVLSVAAHLYAYWEARPGGQVQRATIAIACEVGLHAIAATLLLGWNSGFHYFMLPLVPAALLSSVRSVTARLRIAGTISVAYVALKLWSNHIPPLQPASDPRALQNLETSCVVVLLLALIALAYRYQALFFHTQQALARAAYTDPLTGALNRRRLQQLAYERSSQQPNCLMMCDLDHFKHINDAYGHDAGDAVLQHFHQQLVRSTRATDWVCRWGGEEFLVLMPGTTLEQAHMAAQRLQQQLQAHPTLLASGQSLTITATIGIAPLLPQESLLHAVQRADHALYQGKTQGRNQIVQAPAAATI